MEPGHEQATEPAAGKPSSAFGRDPTEILAERWRLLVILFWAGTCGYLIYNGWNQIGAFSLGDTDDNLRIMQVRALMDGQGWYDLRQYRLSPPEGANIHWSRIPDLPIAALYMLLSPFMGGAAAERWAVGIAPLLPMLAAMYALARTARDLSSPKAFWLAVTVLVCAGSTRSMFAPLRIDHHGWQLAALAWTVAGLAEPRRLMGGVILGAATAFSLAIGLEMLLYLALAGGAVVLMWVRDASERDRLFSYGVTIAGGGTIGFLLFASNDNWAPVCDALSPVWLSVVLVAGAIAVLLAKAPIGSAWLRLGAAVIGGAILAGAYALTWPNCLGRLENVPPELNQLWLKNVREAMPIWRHGWDTVIGIATLPVVGFIGYLVLIWANRREPEKAVKWAAIGAIALFSALLLLWQTRAAAASQLLAVPGCAGLGWAMIAWLAARRHMLVRVLGIGAVFAVVSGAVASVLAPYFDAEPGPPSEYRRQVDTANWRCPTFAALRPVAQQPRGLVLTFVDMGPRLITLTPHDAIAGPYHRNSEDILDIMHAFRGDVANARGVIDRRHVDYVLICPMMSESTIYRSEAPNGFYAQLASGRVPDWLEAVPLPNDSPYKMWRVRR